MGALSCCGFDSDIGGEYEATFSQPLAGSRVYFSTPDLLAGSALPGMSLYASSVHEASHSTNDGENQEKIEGTFRWTDTIGPALVEKPVVTHGPVRVNLAWTRPMHVDSLVYTALPLGATTSKPTIKLAADVTDLKTNITLGFVSRYENGDRKGRGEIIVSTSHYDLSMYG